MSVKFKKWGSSLGVVIPKAIVKKYEIDLEKEYEIIENEEGFYFKEVDNEPSIDELLKGIKRESRYDDSELIKGSVGKERFWE